MNGFELRIKDQPVLWLAALHVNLFFPFPKSRYLK